MQYVKLYRESVTLNQFLRYQKHYFQKDLLVPFQGHISRFQSVVTISLTFIYWWGNLKNTSGFYIFGVKLRTADLHMFTQITLPMKSKTIHIFLFPIRLVRKCNIFTSVQVFSEYFRFQIFCHNFVTEKWCVDKMFIKIKSLKIFSFWNNNDWYEVFVHFVIWFSKQMLDFAFWVTVADEQRRKGCMSYKLVTESDPCPYIHTFYKHKSSIPMCPLHDQ